MATSVYHVIPKEVENRVFRQIAFLDKHVCITNPSWQSTGSHALPKHTLYFNESYQDTLQMGSISCDSGEILEEWNN